MSDSNAYVPEELDSVAKKDDDMTIAVLDMDAGHHVIHVSEDVLARMQHGSTVSGGVTLEDVDDNGITLPFIHDAFTETHEKRPLTVEVDVIYLMYLGNAMFMGAMMLCMGTFWMYVFEVLPIVGPMAWIRHTTMGLAWGTFASLYAMLMWMDIRTVQQSVVLLLAWQTSAVFAVAALAATFHHQAPFHVCAIDFLQSVMVVVYVYGQRTRVSASIAFLLMFMVTVIQWVVATFVFAPVRHSMLSAVLVLVLGIFISMYHAFHIRYITRYDVSHYNLSDMSRLCAMRDLYTDGPRWLGYGVRLVHLRLSRWRRVCIRRITCCCC